MKGICAHVGYLCPLHWLVPACGYCNFFCFSVLLFIFGWLGLWVIFWINQLVGNAMLRALVKIVPYCFSCFREIGKSVGSYVLFFLYIILFLFGKQLLTLPENKNFVHDDHWWVPIITDDMMMGHNFHVRRDESVTGIILYYLHG